MPRERARNVHIWIQIRGIWHAHTHKRTRAIRLTGCMWHARRRKRKVLYIDYIIRTCSAHMFAHPTTRNLQIVGLLHVASGVFPSSTLLFQLIHVCVWVCVVFDGMPRVSSAHHSLTCGGNQQSTVICALFSLRDISSACWGFFFFFYYSYIIHFK